MKFVMQLLLVLAVAIEAAIAQTDLQTVINSRALTREQKAEFLRMYGTPPLAGNFWYDPVSGLWGARGQEPSGVLRPGHAYGPLAATASAGNTGVFINGREINVTEALRIRNLFGSVVPGRWWLDGATGNFGQAGSAVPIGNFFLAARAAQGSGGGSSAPCKTGTIGTGDKKRDYIVGCE